MPSLSIQSGMYLLSIYCVLLTHCSEYKRYINEEKQEKLLPCVTFSNRGVRKLTITKLSKFGSSHKCINAAQ